MKKKLEIVLQLLVDGQITIDEAIVLLEKEDRIISVQEFKANPYTITSTSDLEYK